MLDAPSSCRFIRFREEIYHHMEGAGMQKLDRLTGAFGIGQMRIFRIQLYKTPFWTSRT